MEVTEVTVENCCDGTKQPFTNYTPVLFPEVV
jgi:hypothetical protein